MTHRFPIKEIARQAGLGTATVDRVLNDRPNVSPQSRNRVKTAIRELERQEQQLAAKGRRLFVDVVIEAPRRFSNEVRRATEAVLPNLGMGVFRPRFTMQEVMSTEDALATLNRIAKRGTQGVCLKARDVPALREAVNMLRNKGIPVVTLVTDLRGSKRVAYAGLDNANAGRTAAYLLSKTMPQGVGTVLATRSREEFFGESERFRHFKDMLTDLRPDMKILDLNATGGLSHSITGQVSNALSGVQDLLGVYSMGGGNAAILSTLHNHGDAPSAYVAHDLDAENRKLLRDGRVGFVLHHDLKRDIENALRAIAAFNGLAPAQPERMISDIQIITPYNLSE